MPRWAARSATSLLLVTAAALLVAAAAQRWWPACRPGTYDTDSCLRLQDHVHDHLLVSEPWVPVGDAARYAGAAMAVLAVAALVLPFVLAPAGPGRGRALGVTAPVGVLTAASLGVLGAHAWVAGTTGRVGTGPWVPVATFVLVVVVPAGLAVWAGHEALRDDGDDGGAHRWAVAFAAALVAATPVPATLLGPVVVLYTSHDTSPWSDAVAALPLTLAALLVWKVAPRTAGARRPHPLVGATPAARPS